MANEQTSVPLYAASEVLTAANMNISAGTGVPVFATTVTRDAAFGGANEKVLAEGQLCYLSSTNVVQYYDGAAWATVGPATAGALTLITTTSFSAVASFSLAANTFSSTYTNYQIFMNLDSSAASEILSFRLRASGTDNSSANYAWVLYGWAENTGAQGNDSTGTLASSFRLPAVSGTYTSQMQITLMSPYDTTFNTGFNAQGFYYDSTTNFAGFNTQGVMSVTTAYDSATFIVSSGTVTGSYSVYGLAK